MTYRAWTRAHYLFAGFLAIFGLLNFAELPFGWKDRTEQFTRYLDKAFGLGSDWATPALWGMKSVELVLGTIAVLALTRRRVDWLALVTGAWMIVFTGMSVMDMRVADRAELLEHSSYFAAFSIMLVAILALSVGNRLTEILSRLDRATQDGTTPRPATRQPDNLH